MDEHEQRAEEIVAEVRASSDTNEVRRKLRPLVLAALRGAVAAERERCVAWCERNAQAMNALGNASGAKAARACAADLAALFPALASPDQAEQRAPLTAEQHLQGALDHLRATCPQTPENVVDLCPPKPCLECGRPCTTVYCGVRCVRVGMPAQAEQRVSEEDDAPLELPPLTRRRAVILGHITLPDTIDIDDEPASEGGHTVGDVWIDGLGDRWLVHHVGAGWVGAHREVDREGYGPGGSWAIASIGSEPPNGWERAPFTVLCSEADALEQGE